MGERKLNMNIPLMSVRRFSASATSKRESGKKNEKSQPPRRHTLPTSRAEVNMDHATETVAVPFHWEQIPGRCKNDSGSDHQFPGTASVTPRLPPGRSLSATKAPAKESTDGNKIWLLNKAYSFNENSVKIDYSKEARDIRAGFDVIEDDEEFFSDAMDTRSQTESFSINCSISGVSGFDTWTIEQSDPQTRDFMMNRFLPAAKAMALQPPQYTSRKQSATVERQSQATWQSPAEKRPLLVQNHSNMFLQYGEYKEEEEEESEFEDEVESDTASISAKGCGLVSGLCLRNSLNLLGPIAGMKMKNRLLLPSTSDCAKSSKGPHLRPNNQTVKKALDPAYKKSLGSTSASPDIHDLRNKCNNNSSRFNYSGELQTTGRSSPFRSSRVSGMSPCRSRTQQSPFRGAKLQGFSKEYLNNKPEMSRSAGRGSKILQQVPQDRKIISSGPMAEKTLYIDSISSEEKTHSFSGILRSGHGREDTAYKNSEAISETSKPEENSNVDSLHDIKCVNITEERDLMVSKASGSVQSNSPTLKALPHVRCRLNKSMEFKLDKSYNSQDKSSEKMRKTFDENPDMKAIQTWVFHDSGNDAGYVDGPLPPPLPKSPSESWLWRTLPLVSLKNSLPYSCQATQSYAKVQDSETPSTNIKWETIVKTSNSSQDHVRYSEELVTHISQHQ